MSKAIEADLERRELVYLGRSLTSARVAAGFTIYGLAKAADVAWVTISRYEAKGSIRVAMRARNGGVSSYTWTKITGALKHRGVEIRPRRIAEPSRQRVAAPAKSSTVADE